MYISRESERERERERARERERESERERERERERDGERRGSRRGARPSWGASRATTARRRAPRVGRRAALRRLPSSHSNNSNDNSNNSSTDNSDNMNGKNSKNSSNINISTPRFRVESTNGPPTEGRPGPSTAGCVQGGLSVSSVLFPTAAPFL